MREIAKRRDDQAATNKLFSEVVAINFCSTTVALVLYAAIVAMFFTDEIALYLACGLPIVFNYINIDWLYQGKEEYVYIAIRSILIKGLSIVAIFLFVKSRNDYVISALISRWHSVATMHLILCAPAATCVLPVRGLS
jgi:O-antigen/teichoic acid export membrane protein